MHRPVLFFLLLLVALHAAERPNIIFILADDLGYMDVNAYASRTTGVGKDKMFYETPNIDKLISGGTAFSQGYAYQLCSPTRASLLTGRNAPVLGVTTATPQSSRSYHSLGEKPPAGYLAQDARYWGDPIKTPQSLLNGSTLLALPSGRPEDMGRNELTFAEALPEYRSAFIGKWHVGGHGSLGYQPENQGFEPLAYFDAGGSTYFKWREMWDKKKLNYPEMPQKELLWGKSGEPTGEDYLTDDLTVQADRFIRSHHEKKPDQPFLLYFCEFAVHTPHQAKQADIDYFTNKPTRGWNGHHDPVYASVLRSLDQSVGRLMDTVEELALTDDALFIFMSDNGGVSYITKKGDTPDTSNAPLKGGKASLFEGGIRVPLIFKWPKKIPAGAWSDIPVAAADLFPTIVQAGGIAPATLQAKHRIDGRSLMPLFNDPENKSKAYPRETFYWHYPFNVAPLHTDDEFALTPHSAMRKGDMKIIYDWNGRIWLHDIRKDPYEKTNLAETLPDLTKQLFRELNDWLDANVEKKYMPALNPNYDPTQEVRPKPFKDLRRELLGPDHAIRPAKGDPRLESFLPAPISK